MDIIIAIFSGIATIGGVAAIITLWTNKSRVIVKIDWLENAPLPHIYNVIVRNRAHRQIRFKEVGFVGYDNYFKPRNPNLSYNPDDVHTGTESGGFEVCLEHGEQYTFWLEMDIRKRGDGPFKKVAVRDTLGIIHPGSIPRHIKKRINS